jgi:hypothetical protein
MEMPEHITRRWIDSLSNGDLLEVESRLHSAFVSLEGEEKARRGDRYDLMRAPADLLAAWDSWSRVNTEARVRGLQARRVHRDR